MRALRAMLRAGVLTAASYRLETLFSLLSLATTIVPMYFVGGALQRTAEHAIAGEGGHYFSFLVAGTIAMLCVQTAITALPTAIGGGLRSGTLEAMLATPTPLPKLLAGMTVYGALWTMLRCALLGGVALALGARAHGAHAGAALAILLLTVVPYASLGLLLGAMMLVFRTTGPLPQGIIVASTLLGGVYYPTHVIPSWIQKVSMVVPLSYGLHAMRRLALDGAPLRSVAGDVARLGVFAVVLAVAGTLTFAAALRHARRAGTLGQY